MKRSLYSPYRTTTNLPHRYTLAPHPYWNRINAIGTTTRRPA